MIFRSFHGSTCYLKLHAGTGLSDGSLNGQDVAEEVQVKISCYGRFDGSYAYMT